MKQLILIYFFLLSNSIISQRSFYNKLLFNDSLLIEKVSKEILRDPYFADKILGSSYGDSIQQYHSVKKESIAVVENSEAKCFILTYNDSNSFNISIKNIRGFIDSGYQYFHDEDRSDYKKYMEFIERGLIIATISSTNEILLIHVNFCIFIKNKQKVLNVLNNNKLISNIFIFNCGGEPLAVQIK